MAPACLPAYLWAVPQLTALVLMGMAIAMAAYGMGAYLWRTVKFYEMGTRSVGRLGGWALGPGGVGMERSWG